MIKYLLTLCPLVLVTVHYKFTFIASLNIRVESLDRCELFFSPLYFRGSLASSSSSSTESRSIHRRQPRFHQLQSLAMSALTALTLRPPASVPRNPDAALQTCPAAVHFLPLLTFHISTYCQSLESVESSAKASLHGSSLSGTSDSSLASSLEESLSGQEEFALAAMKALYHIVYYSSEALEMVLSHQDGDVCLNRPKNLLSVSEHLTGEVQTPLSLLRRLLQLADPAFITAAGQREALVSTSLKTLSMLAERAQENQLLRFSICVHMSVMFSSHCIV